MSRPDEIELVHEAFESRDWPTARRLFAERPSLRERLDDPVFPFDTPALVRFAAHQDLEAVDLLLELGADPNRRTGWWAGGFHPLHWARGAVADRLLAGGSVPDACGAAQMGRIDLLTPMLDAGARPGPNLEDAPESVRAVIRAYA